MGKWTGSWLSGPQAAMPNAAASAYPGQRLGRPSAGAGSVAGLGRRLAALIVDWGLSRLVVAVGAHGQLAAVLTLAVFFVEYVVLTGWTGASAGMRLLRLRVVRVDGSLLGIGWASLRGLLLLALVPPLLTDADVRGMHDRAAAAVVVRV